MFFPNIFMNSEEFKDLGTLHYERRNYEYPANGEDLTLQEQARRRMIGGGTETEFFKNAGISAGA